MVSFWFGVVYITHTGSIFSIQDFVDGRAPLPFQYRALTIPIYRLVAALALPLVSAPISLPEPFANQTNLTSAVIAASSLQIAVLACRRVLLQLDMVPA